MKKYVHLGIESASIGITVGFLISLAFSLIFKTEEYYPSAPRFVNQFHTLLEATAVSALLWVLIGLVFGYGSLIFAIEEWSLLKRTVVNCAVYYIGFLPLAIVAGWFPLNGTWIASFTGIYLLVYAFIWAVTYLSERKQVRQINRKLKEQSNDSHC